LPINRGTAYDCNDREWRGKLSKHQVSYKFNNENTRFAISELVRREKSLGW
jgi:hypothetical protein